MRKKRAGTKSIKKPERSNHTFFTSGSWLSIHAISMQRGGINFTKSSKP